MTKSVARETKNTVSTSFAVPDEKVVAKRFLFQKMARSTNQRKNARNITFGNILPNDLQVDNQLTLMNRHATRQNRGVSNSIDFVNHSPVSRHRITTDGGTFPINDSTKQ